MEGKPFPAELATVRPAPAHAGREPGPSTSCPVTFFNPFKTKGMACIK